MNISPQAMRTTLIGVGAALAGAGGGYVYAMKKLSAEYEESASSMRRAYEIALDLKDQRVEAPAEEEHLLSDLADKIGDLTEGIKETFETTGTDFTPATNNPYHTAVTEEGAPPRPAGFVEGAIADNGVSYINEDEWEDDIEFTKHTLSAVVSNEEVRFYLDSVECLDWDDRVGARVKGDMLHLAHTVGTAVTYIRNHNEDADYQVVLERP